MAKAVTEKTFFFLCLIPLKYYCLKQNLVAAYYEFTVYIKKKCMKTRA